MEEIKIKCIDNLKAAGGIVYVACENTGISRTTYYKWYKNDAEFRQRIDETIEAQIDYVESKLMALINSGDTTATIFYLKTKGKKRGWSEKVQLQAVPTAEQPIEAATPDRSLPMQPQAAIEQADGKDKVTFTKRIKNKKDYIVRVLKKQGKYTAELSMQVNVVAQLLVRTEILADEIFDESHSAVNIEISREGNERESVSPKERLYLDYLGQSQKALRALGMNTDARERKTDNDTFNDFISAFKDDEQ